MPRRRSPKTERYEFAASPWVQDLNQRDFATLIGTTKDRLEALIRHKEAWTVRRTELIGRKIRALIYPRGKLRTVHERIKFHLNKIKQPEYLYSPRKGRSQRDNAAFHVNQTQYLSLDIKQFYPSTSSEHIFRWARYAAGLKDDVAGMFTRLVTIDDRMPFGSPLSPVLTALVHRKMFDEIYEACRSRGLRMSLWVDDLTISGKFTPGELVVIIREIVRRNGLQSHKVQFRTGGRPVIITGVPATRSGVMAPRSLNQRIQDGFSALRQSEGDVQRAREIDRLLAHLGTFRYQVGAATDAGRTASNQMEVLRRRRKRLNLNHTTLATVGPLAARGELIDSDDGGVPF